MTEAHRRHAEWSPSRLIAWAKKMGPSVADIVSHLLTTRPHPEQGYRSCLGILRLEKRYGKERLDAACALSMSLNSIRYRSIETILKSGRDQMRGKGLDAPSKTADLQHAHVRGANYFVSTKEPTNTNTNTNKDRKENEYAHTTDNK